MAKLGYSNEEVQSRPLLDPGEYHVRVNTVTVIDGSDGKRDRLTLGLVVASGPKTGSPTFAGFSLPTPEDGEKKCDWEEGYGDQQRSMAGFLLDFVKKAADACGVSWGKTGFDPDDFMGKEAYITVKHREYEGDMQEDVKGWKSFK